MHAIRVRTNMLLMTFMVFVLTPAALANVISLEWRHTGDPVLVGDMVDVALYAVSNSGSDEDFNAAQIILTWEPAALRLIGVSHVGAAFMPPNDTSAFIAGDSWGLNEASPPADGDGVWQGLVALGDLRYATADGTLLTTFVFEALADDGCAEVVALDTTQKPGFVRAFSKIVQGTYNVLDYAGLPVVTCIDIDEPPPIPGDCNGDQVVDVQDFAPNAGCLGGPDVLLPVGCECADLDGDLDVDLADLAQFQTLLGAAP